MDGGGDFSFLKKVIFRIPGKNDKDGIRYPCEDREDRPSVIFLQGVEDILNGFES